jgi:outer membrane protein assembly factor BamB
VDVLWGGPDKPNLKMKSKFSSPLLVDGYLYGLDEGVLTCLDPATGDRKWIGSRTAPSRGRYKHGQMLQTNGLLVILSEEGDVVLVRPQPDQLVEIGQMHVLDGAKTWNPPALVRGKLYARNHEEMACVDLCSTDSTPQVAEEP